MLASSCWLPQSPSLHGPFHSQFRMKEDPFCFYTLLILSNTQTNRQTKNTGHKESRWWSSILKKYNISFHCYADDTQLYMPLKPTNPKAVSKLIECLEDIKAWMSLNFLSLNENKTEILLCKPSKACKNDFDLGPLRPHVKDSVRNLGVIFDSDFKMDEQIISVVKSSFFHLRLLSKVKPFLSPRNLETAIHTFITSRLDYCNALYAGLGSLSRLQLVQNAAAWFLTRTRKREHITPVLKALHWLPVRFRIHFKILLFVFKSLKQLAPSYIADFLHHHTPLRSLRSSDQLLLTIPPSRLKSRGDRAFAVLGPKLWNELPLHVRLAPSVPIFKSRLKTHLFSLTLYEWCDYSV